MKAAVHAAQEQVRLGTLAPDIETVTAEALRLLPESATSLRAVLNATGVVLHTNLGRAALSTASVAALATAAGTVDVELDLATGERARRGRGDSGRPWRRPFPTPETLPSSTTALLRCCSR